MASRRWERKGGVNTIWIIRRASTHTYTPHTHTHTHTHTYLDGVTRID